MYPTDGRVSPDGFIHTEACAVWTSSACSCGAAADPDSGYAIGVAREGILLPADGVMRTVLLDGVPVSASVRVIPASDVEAATE